MPDPNAGGGGVCLCVLFNQPFVANIPLLRRIYAGRFAQVRFLVPFARVDEPDVLTVYRGSFGHCAYAVEHLTTLAALGCSHYVFVHDDVLLSPYLDERNLHDRLGLEGDGEGWIGELGLVPNDVGYWGYQLGSLWRLMEPGNLLAGTGTGGVEAVLRHLPAKAEAVAKSAAYDLLPETTLYYDPGRFPWGELERRVAERLFGAAGEQPATIPYPLACSGPFTDCYVVPHRSLSEFAHIAAVLVSAGLFVEMAAPTALYLACERVRTAAAAAVRQRWDTVACAPDDALDALVADRGLLSVHPVKLSTVGDADRFIARLDAVMALA